LTLLLAVAGAVGGGLLGHHLSKKHVATMSVLVSPLNGNPFSAEGNGDDLVNMASEAQMVKSNDVAKKVRHRESVRASLNDLRAGLKVDVPPNTQIVKISYASESRETAIERDQWFGEEFLANRTSRAKALTTSQQTKTDQEVASRKREQKGVNQELSKAKRKSAKARLLRSQVKAIADQIEQLRTSSAETEGAASDPGRIITGAAIDSPGMLGSWITFALGGLIAGLVIGVAIAAIRSRADARVRHVDDLVTAGHSVLGEITFGDAKRARAAFGSMNFRLPEALRDIRTSILTADHQRPTVIALATTARSGELPVTAAGIALATSSSDLATCVVEATGAQLPIHHGPADLSSALANHADLDQAITSVNGQLRVLPPGGQSGRVDDSLFLSPRMHTVLTYLRHKSDVVLLVGGNAQEAATRALIDLADSVVIEVVEGASSYDDLYQTANGNQKLAKKLLGAVFVSHTSEKGKHQSHDASAVAQDQATTVPAHLVDGHSPWGAKSDLASMSAPHRDGPVMQPSADV
jgi:capsular polysaccharide biosynthesis protein